MIELQAAEYIQGEQGTPQWHALRANKIGASDAASILGIGYNSIDKLWRIKTGLEVVKQNAAMRRGSLLEPKARQQFIETIGARYEPAIYVSKQYPWLMASLDGINDSGTAILEIKCGGNKLHCDAMNGIVPPYYYSQMQHQLLVTGLETCYYYSFDGEDSGALVIIQRDQAYIDDYLPKSKKFWDCIQSLTPPD